MSESISRPLHRRIIYNLFRLLAQWLSVGLLNCRVLGREHLPLDGGGLILSTHQSNFDPVLIGLSCNRRLNYIARKTLFHNRMLAALIRFLDAIEMDRERGGLEGIRETIARLRQGELVLIFPEGTRSPDGAVGSLKSGFLMIARRSKVPLIPVAIVGAFDVLPRGTKWPKHHPIAVVFGKPILPCEFEEMKETDLMQRLMDHLLLCDQKGRDILPVLCKPL